MLASRRRVSRALFFVVAAVAAFARGGAQVIQIKTLPIAEGDQWRIFPSANAAMGDVSIALADSLLDPFGNPAKGSRVTRGGAFFGSPTFYSMTQNSGGGRTLPFGGVVRSGNVFAGFALALQEIDTSQVEQRAVFAPAVASSAVGIVTTAPVTPLVAPAESHQNRYVFGSVGRVFPERRVSLGASVLWSGLNDVDGVDMLYQGSAGVVQSGGSVDARVGVTKDWTVPSGTATGEALLLHDHFSMAQDVTWPQQVWNPNTGTFETQGRVDHNLDRTDTWGLQLGYTLPLPDSVWRIGVSTTGNLATHPQLPDYQLAQVVVVPWDPGHSAAADLGVGISKVEDGATFGFDAIYEPITTHTWGEAQTATETVSGATIPAGGMTTENSFHFSNAILRSGVGRELSLGNNQALVVQLGLGLRAINYRLVETDHVAETTRLQHEFWNEWTTTWGATLRFTNLEIRYTGRMLTGDGRPGVSSGAVFTGPVAASSGPDVLSAPNGNLSLGPVTTMTHQISVAFPLR